MNMQEIKNRWNATTPIFFKKLRKLAITVGSAAVGVWMINISMSLGLGDIILSICKYTIAFSAAVGLTAQITAKSPENL